MADDVVVELLEALCRDPVLENIPSTGLSHRELREVLGLDVEPGEVVAVMGLGRDAWPDLRLRDTMTRSGLLVEAVMDRLTRGADGRLSAGTGIAEDAR